MVKWDSVRQTAARYLRLILARLGEDMHDYQVELNYGSTFVVPADDYSYSGDRVLFWIGQRIVRSFPRNDVKDVKRIS